MAITLNYANIVEKFKDVKHKWKDIGEFELFYIRYFTETMPDTIYYTAETGEELVIGPMNHFPDLKEYEVWMEGYAATGEHQGASFIGKAKARNFAQACDIVMCQQHLKYIEEFNRPDGVSQRSNCNKWTYDPEMLSDWGCRLYWSEELAKKSFG